MVALGNVVVLKSGGPAMTVSEIHESDNMLVCVYYSQRCGEIHSISVHKEAITVIKQGSAPKIHD